MSSAVCSAVEIACARIAPLWPLKHFVAVNPFLGFVDQSFPAACAMLHRIARVDMLMPRSYYREALEHGLIREIDIQAALNAIPPGWNTPRTVRSFLDALALDASIRTIHPAHVPTVAEVLDSLAEGNRFRSGTAFMVDEISTFCAAYFDQGQSSWRLPWGTLPLYTAWRHSVRHDRNPEAMGVRNFRSIVGRLPMDAIEAIAAVVSEQAVPVHILADYFHQALISIGGWAAYARYLRWDRELRGERDDTLVHLLSIRLSFGYALFSQRTDVAFQRAWKRAMEVAALPSIDDRLGNDPDLAVDVLAQEAYEHGFQRRLLTTLREQHPVSALSLLSCKEIPAVQATFCIDVRSEIFRRAFERECPSAQTLGFAGFFGFPIEYVPLGHRTGGAQCPVLVAPSQTVCEIVRNASSGENERIQRKRLARGRVAKAWKGFKTAAVSAFVFVEACGLLFAPKLATDSLALTRPVRDPDTDGLDRRTLERLGPSIEVASLNGSSTGFTGEQKIDMATAVLRGMSLTSGFAPLVLLVGHGSTTVNNPYASALDCGACGGYTGEANARVAALILNDPFVRAALHERSIHVPQETWFIAALHDTTTDQVRIFDENELPLERRAELQQLQSVLDRASSAARHERARLLRINEDQRTDRAMLTRSRDWSQVRPEWGLARNAAFIAAPRARTSSIDFGGRVFLHEYTWRTDESFLVLEMIMTAPLIVASWINLQYYGSTVNNATFGSGNKVLHNITGALGVLEGSAGDLKAGLPWQAVHDGERYVHEPLRLSAFIEAPLQALDAVIAKHETIRNLVENRWMHLFHIDETGNVSHRHHGRRGWTAVDA